MLRHLPRLPLHSTCTCSECYLHCCFTAVIHFSGYASIVYKAQCKRSGETVVLKVYTLAAVCDLYKYQVRQS